MLTLFYKEINGFLSSLVAYITIGIFLLALGLFLWVFPESGILDYGYATLDSMFGTAPFLFMFMIPALTMRSFSEEKKDGTFELLATRPLTDWQIILGKYFACACIVLFAMVPTLLYYFSVYDLGVIRGNIDSGAVIGSYIGLLLLGSAFTAIGIFASSITQNQIIAFAIAVFLCFFSFSGFESISQLLSLRFIDVWIASMGASEHYQSISRGVLDTRDLVYFLSIIAIFLVLTKTVLGGRKW